MAFHQDGLTSPHRFIGGLWGMAKGLAEMPMGTKSAQLRNKNFMRATLFQPDHGVLFGKGDLTKESRPDAQLREVYPSLPEDASVEHARGSPSASLVLRMRADYHIFEFFSSHFRFFERLPILAKEMHVSLSFGVTQERIN